uniref:Uncharacterized protein n=2 Tax=Sipha flava TaxID=143950 RepID=A0A2S2QFT5_9HEMI
MMVCRYKRNENHWNHFNRFLCIIIILTHGNLAAAQADRNDCGGKTYSTCTGCVSDATVPKYQWSVWTQTCTAVKPNAKQRGKTVVDQSSCPRFSVDWRPGGGGETTIAISNDQTDFVGSLKKMSSQVRCRLDSTSYAAEVTDDGRIRCALDAPPVGEGGRHDEVAESKKSMVHLSVVFASNRTLRFDNATDHYQHRNGTPVASCSRCHWNDDGYAYYCIWCGSTTPPFQYCDRRKYPELTYSALDESVRFVGDQCAPVKIESFAPTGGKWAGGTVLEIVVRNHETLLRTNMQSAGVNVKLVVRVAGRKCDTSKNVSNRKTITCTLSQPRASDSEVYSGPVEVTYLGLLDIKLVSTQNFSFSDYVTSSSPSYSLSDQSYPSTTPLSSTPFTPPPTTLPPTTPPPTTSLPTTPPPTTPPPTTPPPTTPPPTTPPPTSPPPTTPPPTTPPPTTPPPSSNLSPLPASTSSLLPSTTPLLPPASTSLPPPSQTHLLPQSSTLAPSSSPISVSTTKFPEKVNTTEEAFNINFTLSRTAPVLSTVVTIVMYVLFIMVLCVALLCLKSPRTYDLLTFRLRQRPMEMRRLDEDQQLTLSVVDFNEHGLR